MSKKRVKVIKEDDISSMAVRVDRLEREANTGRVIKHKMASAEARGARKLLRKMVVQREKQEGTF